MKKRGKNAIMNINARERKAVSPVVSTVLLIVLVVILAIIIFLWARGFIQEKVEKFDKPIESSCSEVNFDASISADKSSLSVVNKGNVPIYSLDLKISGEGESDIEHLSPINLNPGSSDPSIVLPTGYSYSEKTITVIPVLLGKSGNENKQYTCPEKNGIEIEV